MNIKDFTDICLNIISCIIFCYAVFKFGNIAISEYQKTKQEERNLIRSKAYKEEQIGYKYKGGR